MLNKYLTFMYIFSTNRTKTAYFMAVLPTFGAFSFGFSVIINGFSKSALFSLYLQCCLTAFLWAVLNKSTLKCLQVAGVVLTPVNCARCRHVRKHG